MGWARGGLGYSCGHVATASSFFALRWVWVRADCAAATSLRSAAFGGHPARSAPPPTRRTRLPPKERRLATPIPARRWCKTPVAGPKNGAPGAHHIGALRSVLHHLLPHTFSIFLHFPLFGPLWREVSRRPGWSGGLSSKTRTVEQCESTETVFVLVTPTRLEPLLGRDGFVQAAACSSTRRVTLSVSVMAEIPS